MIEKSTLEITAISDRNQSVVNVDERMMEKRGQVQSGQSESNLIRASRVAQWSKALHCSVTRDPG